MLQALRGESTSAQALPGLESWPVPAGEALKARYLGSDIRDLDGPAVILDLAVLRKNCKLMLETAEALQLGWRAHVKTHKVGEAPKPVKLIVSTVNEALFLLPWLFDCKKQGRTVNVIYGVPPSSTCFKRLAPLREQLGSDSLGFLLDHPAQLQNLIGNPSAAAADPVPVWIKVDAGYHRAGVPANSQSLQLLLDAIKHAAQGRSQPHITLVGFYSHMGHSYGAQSSTDALQFLADEINGAAEATANVSPADFGVKRFVLSVGATPTASSAANLLTDPAAGAKVKEAISNASATLDVELHAGVYPTLDMQQLSTHARGMSTDDIGIRVIAEVLSVYDQRETPEALIGAGSLALGREPCQSYPGWGIVAPSPWLPKSHPSNTTTYDEDNKSGWIVKKISQEHGILGWEGPQDAMHPLTVGQKLLIWPNHACIAGPNFFGYFVVDSGRGEDKKGEIVDVWVRARGW